MNKEKLPKINNDINKELINSKNLLAFSGGVDSSAMFHYLIENNIKFDIAIVNYNLREESYKEVEYAQELSKTYNIKLHIHEVDGNYSKTQSSFESKARDIRYSFFNKLTNENKYNNLLTGHHLNDRVEWMMMQFTKGAGLKQMYGMNEIDKRDEYTIVRPFFEFSRDEIENYLDANNIKHFIDSTNSDEKYKRNYFRKNFASKLVNEYSEGIKNSFKYMKEDIKEFKEDNVVNVNKKFYIIKLDEKSSNNSMIRAIDQLMKIKFGIVMSYGQKKELVKAKFDSVVSKKIAVVLKDMEIQVAPYEIPLKMDKKSKNKFRENGISPKIRGYLFNLDVKCEEISKELELNLELK